MNKDQRKAQSRARHDRQVARRLEKKKALQAQSEVPAGDDEELDETEEVTAETDQEDISPDPDLDEDAGDDSVFSGTPVEVKKDYGMNMAMPMAAPMGPTSWDELDSARMAEEQSHELRMASYDVEDLVRNILNHPVMEAADKADAIQAVGAGFQGRVDSILSSDGNMEDMQKDLDLLTVEAMIGYDRRHSTVQERIGDWVSKAALSYGAKKAKPDSAYALVTTRGGVKVRKYLIHDKAHVRNALARAAQMMKRGGMAAADAKAALPKIHAAAKRMGIGMEKSIERSAIWIEKDAAGNLRWVGWASNNFKDIHADIISKAAHEEYEQFLDANPGMAPVFMSWHTPGTQRTHPVDYWHFENGFMIMSGILEPHEAAALLKAKAETDLGMSFQGFGIRGDEKDPRVITKYRMFEVSDLPLESAANPFTAFAVLSKEQEEHMDKKQYLAKILGSEEKADAYMKQAELAESELTAAGVEKKEVAGAPQAAPKPEEKVAKVLTQAASAPGADVKTIVEQVLKELDAEGLNAFLTQYKDAVEKIPVLEAVIKSMQANQDDELAKKIAPPAQKFIWATKERASASKATEVKDDDELLKATPGLGDNWLSQATNTSPIDVSQVH